MASSLTRISGSAIRSRRSFGRWQTFSNLSNRQRFHQFGAVSSNACRYCVPIISTIISDHHHSSLRLLSTETSRANDDEDEVSLEGREISSTMDNWEESTTTSSPRDTLNNTAIREIRGRILNHSRMNSFDGAYKSNALLDDLIEESIRTGRQLVNISIYNNVLDAWSRCGRKGCGKALKLLEAMHQRHQQHPTCCPSPNTVSYHSVLNACARSAAMGHPEAALTAEKLIKEMEQHSSDHPEGDIHPVTQSYSTVILTQANQAHEVYGAAGAAEDWLHYLSKLNTEGGPSVDTHCFNHVLKAWKMCPEDKGADRALEVLNLMMKLFRNGHHETVAPDEISFGHVIDAFCQRNRPDEAEGVLKMALAFFLDDDTVKRFLLDRQFNLTTCFNIVISGWAKSEESDAPERATALLMDMKALSQETDHVLTEPDVITHTACIEAIARSGREDAPEMVEAKVFSMLEQHRRHGSRTVPPNAATFDCAIRTWYHRTGKPNRAPRMEALLNKSIELAQRHNDATLVPKPRTVNMCIGAWGETSVSKALDLLNRMEVVPCVNHASYLLFLERLLRDTTDDTTAEKQEKAFAAAIVLEKFQTQVIHRGIMKWPADPLKLYNRTLFALAKVGTGDAADRAFSLLEGMERNVKQSARPNVASYTATIRALSKRPNKARTQKALLIFEHMWKLHHDKKIKLDTTAFLAMMSYLANVKERWAADRAYDLLGNLSQMHAKSRDHKKLLPNYRCYDKCLQALARCEDLASLQSSVKMLQHFVEEFRETRSYDLPSEAGINTVITFCNQHGGDEGKRLAEQATTIKEELRHEGNLHSFQSHSFDAN
ncbi:Pentatricopeptide repeat-containing protein [Seminavis robusta]|uniref:Pentatricopeptide repeat-containing protein n=1 Tax=Seminavis robusta TaxID=568900 RepID=A0A9N8F0C8_9STRA|nr:Pentatricopeptide repeat-containing protein [Seminavis robusta]|eukprot:Sro2427_g327360.1 Pentatricopeptide repeat-containing protein (830) ;mRNA; r:10545-13034